MSNHSYCQTFIEYTVTGGCKYVFDIKKTLICWKTEFTIVYGKIEMQKKGSKNTQQGRSFYAQTEPPHVNLVLIGLCTFSSPFYELSA